MRTKGGLRISWRELYSIGTLTEYSFDNRYADADCQGCQGCQAYSVREGGRNDLHNLKKKKFGFHLLRSERIGVG